MSKQTLGLICSFLLLTGCAAASKPVANSIESQPGASGTKSSLQPPLGAMPDRLPPLNPVPSTPTDVMPAKGESEQQVDPSKLRQSQ